MLFHTFITYTLLSFDTTSRSQKSYRRKRKHLDVVECLSKDVLFFFFWSNTYTINTGSLTKCYTLHFVWSSRMRTLNLAQNTECSECTMFKKKWGKKQLDGEEKLLSDRIKHIHLTFLNLQTSPLLKSLNGAPSNRFYGQQKFESCDRQNKFSLSLSMWQFHNIVLAVSFAHTDKRSPQIHLKGCLKRRRWTLLQINKSIVSSELLILHC